MKRLTSILLALLMLVGMALAEETPDAALGDWYALNTENEAICLTLREDGTFCYDSREGTWRKTTDGEYWLTYNIHDLPEVMERMVNSQAAEQDLTALLTETGLTFTTAARRKAWWRTWCGMRKNCRMCERRRLTRRWKHSRGLGRWKPCSSARCS